MKRKQLERLIRAAALREMPDVLDRIDLDLIRIPVAVSGPKIRRPRVSLMFALKAVLVLMLVTITGALVYEQIVVAPPVVLALESEAEVYGFQMVSATSLLAQFADTDISIGYRGGHGDHMTTEEPTVTETASEPLVTVRLDKVTEYLNTMEVMLAEKDVTTYAITPSDAEGYEWTLTFTTLDLLGEELTYHIDYNETVDPEHADRRTITGVMTLGDATYDLSGVVHSEDGALRTSFLATRGNDSIAITDLTDADGQKYRYDVVRDGAAYETVTMRLTRVGENLVAAIARETDAETYEFTFRRADDGAGFAVAYTYRCADGTETGQMQVEVDYDEVAAGFVYRYVVQAETGPCMGQGHGSGNRTDKTRESGNRHLDVGFTMM